MQVYPPAGVIFTGIGVLLSVSIFFDFLNHCDTHFSQTAVAVSASRDALADVFERFECFFSRMETYAEVPLAEGMTEIIVKIMIEVISILGIAMKGMKQSRASELITSGVDHLLRLTVV